MHKVLIMIIYSHSLNGVATKDLIVELFIKHIMVIFKALLQKTILQKELIKQKSKFKKNNPTKICANDYWI